MPRFSTGTRSTGTGSTALPLGSIYAANPGGGRLRECGVFNTTGLAVAIKLVRLTSLGTPGTALVETPHLEPLGAPACVAYDTHTGAPTLGGDLGYRAQLGAAVGTGIIWTFGDTGLVLQPSTLLGVGILVAAGVGQVCDWYVTWDEGTDAPPAPTIAGEVDRRAVYLHPSSLTALEDRLVAVDQTLSLILAALTEGG